MGNEGEEREGKVKIPTENRWSNPAMVQRTLKNLNLRLLESDISLNHCSESVCVPVLMYMDITNTKMDLSLLRK